MSDLTIEGGSKITLERHVSSKKGVYNSITYTFTVSNFKLIMVSNVSFITFLVDSSSLKVGCL